MTKQQYIYLVKTTTEKVGTNILSYYKTFNGALAKVQEVESLSLAQYNRNKEDNETYDVTHEKGQYDPKGVWSLTIIYCTGANDKGRIIQTISIQRENIEP